MAKQKTMACSFGGVGIGKDKARISISVDAEKIGAEDMIAMFVGAQLTGKLVCGPSGEQDADGQQVMKGLDRELDVVAESRGFHTYGDRYTVSLSVSKADTDLGLLADFANRNGKIKLKRTGDVDTVSGEEDDDGNED